MSVSSKEILKNKTVRNFFISPLSLPKLRRRCGRNNSGVIVVRHRGGGAKRICRLVDFSRSLTYVPGRVCQIVKDSIRTNLLALVCFSNGVLTLILASHGLKVGSYIISLRGRKVKSRIKSPHYNYVHPPGSADNISCFLAGSIIHNISISQSGQGLLVRAAGTKAKLVRTVVNKYVLIRLPSLKEAILNINCFAVSGRCANIEHKLSKFLLAGHRRFLGWRPTVRGVAMNPIDHPHGGGEGKTSGGRCSVTPWGRLTKGRVTSAPKKRLRRKNLRLLLNKL